MTNILHPVVRVCCAARTLFCSAWNKVCRRKTTFEFFINYTINEKQSTQKITFSKQCQDLFLPANATVDCIVVKHPEGIWPAIVPSLVNIRSDYSRAALMKKVSDIDDHGNTHTSFVVVSRYDPQKAINRQNYMEVMLGYPPPDSATVRILWANPEHS